MRRRRVKVSATEARRIALAAQGFDRDRPAAPDARHWRRLFRELGLLQLDFVNVLVPAHYLVAWSRLGHYDRTRFDAHVHDSGEYVEQWAHEASIVPVDTWPLLAHRRAAWPSWRNGPLARLPDAPRYLDNVLAQVRDEGALTADRLPQVPTPRGKPGDWHRSFARRALEFHFGRGALAVSRRLGNFQRVYDLPDRLVPAQHLACPPEGIDAQTELLRRAACSLGIATLGDLADYYRMSPRDASRPLERLLDTNAVTQVEVEGWRQPAYLSATARVPRRINGASLLSPFDPLVWCRPRAERLFGFHYRLEIYVPAAKRRWGYYVLPFRLGENIVARVDLKADRQSGCLRVRAAYCEENADPDTVVGPLAGELHALAEWLGIADVAVARQNAFSRRLADASRSASA